MRQWHLPYAFGIILAIMVLAVSCLSCISEGQPSENQPERPYIITQITDNIYRVDLGEIQSEQQATNAMTAALVEISSKGTIVSISCYSVQGYEFNGAASNPTTGMFVIIASEP